MMLSCDSVLQSSLVSQASISAIRNTLGLLRPIVCWPHSPRFHGQRKVQKPSCLFANCFTAPGLMPNWRALPWDILNKFSKPSESVALVTPVSHLTTCSEQKLWSRWACLNSPTNRSCRSSRPRQLTRSTWSNVSSSASAASGLLDLSLGPLLRVAFCWIDTST